MKIKNIIFDFGGVIINIDESNVTQALIDRGSKNVDKLHQHLLDNNIYNKLETGKISDQEFREEIKNKSDLDLNDQDVDDIWNTLIMDLPPNRFRLLEEIRNNYKTFLLSNTDVIHHYFYQDMFRNKYGLMSLDELFEKGYYSFMIGIRKPDPEIFQIVLEENALIPAETLFIDDTLNNVLAARKLGMYAWHLKADEEITDLFQDGLLSVDLSNAI